MRPALACSAILCLLFAACSGATYGELDGGMPGAGEHASDGGTQMIVVPDGGKLPLYAACSSSDQCESGICNSYPAKGGSFCVNACTPDDQATTCPPPSTGCNHMGFCKVP